MTRFARAKGSKASNERVPEEATPWSQMKQQLLEKNREIEENKSRQEAINRRNANYKAFLEEKEEEESKKIQWADFPVDTQYPTSSKTKKVKSFSSTVIDDLSDNDEDFLALKAQIDDVLDGTESINRNSGDNENSNALEEIDSKTEISKSSKIKKMKKKKLSILPLNGSQINKENTVKLNKKPKKRKIKEETTIEDNKIEKTKIDNSETSNKTKEKKVKLKKLKETKPAKKVMKENLTDVEKPKKRKFEEEPAIEDNKIEKTKINNSETNNKTKEKKVKLKKLKKTKAEKKVIKENLTDVEIRKIEKKKLKKIKQLELKKKKKADLKKQQEDKQNKLDTIEVHPSVETEKNEDSNVESTKKFPCKEENKQLNGKFEKRNNFNKNKFNKQTNNTRNDGDHSRRKPQLPSKMFINGKEVEIDYVDGFPVKKEDANRLRKLRKEMISKGLPRSEINIALKLERRKAEKAFSREKKKVCFNCRKSGHNLSECPDLNKDQVAAQSGTGICFKCGSTEHTHFECKVVRGQEFKYAQCFVCNEQGHIARQCPDNARGLYPKGGACNVCGDVTHLKKDCPKYQAQQQHFQTSVDIKTINGSNPDDLGDINSRGNFGLGNKKMNKIIKF